MKIARLAVLSLLCSAPLLASAQWIWLDKDGRKVFSDQAPPADIAPNRILKQKGSRPEAAAAAPAPAPSAAPAATATAAVPKPTGKDPALEKKRKEAEAAEAAKKKQEEEKIAQAKAENCNSAKSGKAALNAGIRIAQVNSKGEREFMDDNQRAAEAKRLDAIIARDCATQ